MSLLLLPLLLSLSYSLPANGSPRTRGAQDPGSKSGLIPITRVSAQRFLSLGGNLSPKAIEIEESVSGNATKIGTNFYPRVQNGSDPVLGLPQFQSDSLSTFLQFGGVALSNTPLLNAESTTMIDWVRDTLINEDSASNPDGVVSGIIPDVTGALFNGAKRGHWNGIRVVDGVGASDNTSFGGGSRDDDVTTWTYTDSSVGKAALDITQAYFANTSFPTNDLANFPSGVKHVIYFAVERRGNNGSGVFEVEFNQRPPLLEYLPNRSEGDVLFAFEVTGSGGNGAAIPHVYVYRNGNFLSNEIFTGSIPIARRPVASINQAPTPSGPWGYIDEKGNWTVGQIPKFCVFEGAMPFGVDFLTAVSTGGRPMFQVRSRGSLAANSDLKDTSPIVIFESSQP